MVERARAVIVLYIVVLLRKLVLLKSIRGDICKGGGGREREFIANNENFIEFAYQFNHFILLQEWKIA